MTGLSNLSVRLIKSGGRDRVNIPASLCSKQLKAAGLRLKINQSLY